MITWKERAVRTTYEPQRRSRTLDMDLRKEGLVVEIAHVTSEPSTSDRAVAVATLWLGSSETFARLRSLRQRGRSMGRRLQIAEDSWRLFWLRPVAGWGIGQFHFVFSKARSYYSDSFAEYADSDYVQLLMETGLVGLACTLWFLVVFYRQTAHLFDDYSRDLSHAVGAAALTGCTGIVVHSFVDSNMHVPANAVLFSVWATIASSRPTGSLVSPVPDRLNNK